MLAVLVAVLIGERASARPRALLREGGRETAAVGVGGSRGVVGWVCETVCCVTDGRWLS